MLGCLPFLCTTDDTSTTEQRYWIPANLRGNMVKIKKSKIEAEYNIFLDKELGKGGCGVVVFGENKKTGAKYAIKIVEKKSIEKVRFDREVKLLKDFDHINIVRLFSVYDSSAKFYFVMELCTGGHLGGYIERQHEGHISEAKAKPLFRQLMSAIAHMHSRGIAHRDIKLQNILIDQSVDDRNVQLKVIDFGFGSKYIGALPMRSHVGTLYTTAPEVIRECYDERCDVWSAGVVLYIMLSGKRPFETYDTKGVLEKAGKATIITNILAGRFAFHHSSWKKVSRVGTNYVKELLHPDYKARMRSSDALEHQWFDKTPTAIATTPSSLKAVSNMKKLLNNNENIVQTGMMAAVFAMNSTPAQDLRTVFQSFDKDASGAISFSEFSKALKALAPDLSDADVERLFNCIDIDKNRTISYTEFLAATLDPKEVDIGDLSRAFHILDEDGNGYITKAELYHVLKTQMEQTLDNFTKSQGDLNDGSLSRGSSKAMSPQAASSRRTLEDNLLQQTKHSVSSLLRHSFDEKPAPTLQAAALGMTVLSKDDIEKAVTEKISKIFSQVDRNNDGVISEAEFLYAMTGLDFQVNSQAATAAMILRRDSAFSKSVAGSVVGAGSHPSSVKVSSSRKLPVKQASARDALDSPAFDAHGRLAKTPSTTSSSGIGDTETATIGGVIKSPSRNKGMSSVGAPMGNSNKKVHINSTLVEDIESS